MKDALALALVHFLWQGALLGALGWGLMRLGRSASVRYVIGVVTLAAMCSAPIITFAVMIPRVPAAVASTSPFAAASRVSTAPSTRTPSSATQVPALPTTWILTAWLLGVSLLSVRLAGGWVVARRLVTTSVTPLPQEIAEAASALALRMGVYPGVRVLLSSRAAVPMMLGWWRPVVLIPLSAISGMSLRQIEALLAHEFAHIRRHDYLVNLLQTVVETMCFYHPAVWLMSREVRRERELCCDDIGVSTCDRVTYVIALARVAEIASPQLALAASGGSLRDRIRRLVLPSAQPEPTQGGWLLLLPVICVLALAVPQAMPSQTPREVPPHAVSAGHRFRSTEMATQADPSSWGMPIGATEVLEKPFVVEVKVEFTPGSSASLYVDDCFAPGPGDSEPIYYLGRTPAQVEAQFRQAYKNLGSNPTVTVTARRPPVTPGDPAPAASVGSTPESRSSALNRSSLKDLQSLQAADRAVLQGLTRHRDELQRAFEGGYAEAVTQTLCSLGQQIASVEARIARYQAEIDRRNGTPTPAVRPLKESR